MAFFCGGRVCVLTWLSRAFYPTKLVMVGWLVGNTHTKILPKNRFQAKLH